MPFTTRLVRSAPSIHYGLGIRSRRPNFFKSPRVAILTAPRVLIRGFTSTSCRGRVTNFIPSHGKRSDGNWSVIRCKDGCSPDQYDEIVETLNDALTVYKNRERNPPGDPVFVGGATVPGVVAAAGSDTAEAMVVDATTETSDTSPATLDTVEALVEDAQLGVRDFVLEKVAVNHFTVHLQATSQKVKFKDMEPAYPTSFLEYLPGATGQGFLHASIHVEGLGAQMDDKLQERLQRITNVWYAGPAGFEQTIQPKQKGFPSHGTSMLQALVGLRGGLKPTPDGLQLVLVPFKEHTRCPVLRFQSALIRTKSSMRDNQVPAHRGFLHCSQNQVGSSVNELSTAHKDGISSVEAAGNDNFPSLYAEGTESWFSCYGNIVDVCAPGEQIQVTKSGGGHGEIKGTSWSATQITQIVAGLLPFVAYSIPNAISVAHHVMRRDRTLNIRERPTPQKLLAKLIRKKRGLISLQPGSSDITDSHIEWLKTQLRILLRSRIEKGKITPMPTRAKLDERVARIMDETLNEDEKDEDELWNRLHLSFGTTQRAQCNTLRHFMESPNARSRCWLIVQRSRLRKRVRKIIALCTTVYRRIKASCTASAWW
ncbi:hypothetical protein LTR56_026398 [Elasticomyces elasticus]|nr:hypothetical protein LTR56_026398 [Elasticomyces elasticus]KAK4908148.1 hypothetical protein LTR49_022927 [Elasticomyces elasticus]KAK5748169.1 hypothetical protein LTS12_021769 [Elasticomyces elasticus]